MELEVTLGSVTETLEEVGRRCEVVEDAVVRLEGSWESEDKSEMLGELDGPWKVVAVVSTALESSPSSGEDEGRKLVEVRECCGVVDVV